MSARSLVRHLHHQLAEISALAQADERFRRLIEAVHHILAVFELPALSQPPTSRGKSSNCESKSVEAGIEAELSGQMAHFGGTAGDSNHPAAQQFRDLPHGSANSAAGCSDDQYLPWPAFADIEQTGIGLV